MNDATESSCESCGDELLPGAVYCIGCGTPVHAPPLPHRPLFVDEVYDEPAASRSVRGVLLETPEEPLPPQPPGRAGTVPILVMIAVLVLVAGGLGYVLGKDRIVPRQTGAAPTAGTDPDPGQATVDPEAPPQDQLFSIARLDTEAAGDLVGAWIPQLAAVGEGEGGDADWSSALARYRDLKAAHPDVLLLDTDAWPSAYARAGMYAVVVPYPSETSAPALEWCVEHGLPGTSCAAKHLEVSGDPSDNYDAQ